MKCMVTLHNGPWFKLTCWIWLINDESSSMLSKTLVIVRHCLKFKYWILCWTLDLLGRESSMKYQGVFSPIKTEVNKKSRISNCPFILCALFESFSSNSSSPYRGNDFLDTFAKYLKKYPCLKCFFFWGSHF